MKNILVTGGAGFIGSNLCKKLMIENNKVVCLDNFYSSSQNNIDCLLSFNNFTFINKDVIDNIDLQVDEIYHLACPASPVFYQKDPIYTFKTNIYGAFNLLENATKYKSKILLSSTSEIYGDPEQTPQRESYWGNVNPNGIRSCYDEGKRGSESIFFDYKRKKNTRIKVCRIFNCYGPNMAVNDGRVVSNFIVAALNNKPITVYGDGFQTRSFCYVDDLIIGLQKLMDTDDSITGPINLGNPQEISILQIAKLIINLTNSRSKIVFCDLPKDDPKMRKPEIKLAQEILKWKPIVNLENGLKKTIEYFDTIL